MPLPLWRADKEPKPVERKGDQEEERRETDVDEPGRGEAFLHWAPSPTPQMVDSEQQITEAVADPVYSCQWASSRWGGPPGGPPLTLNTGGGPPPPGQGDPNPPHLPTQDAPGGAIGAHGGVSEGGAPEGASEGAPEAAHGGVPRGFTERTPGRALEQGGLPEAPAAIPVTIVTGLLGAGKTTLLRRLLKASGGLRLLLVQNEFSEQMGIEAPTLVEATPQQQHQQQQKEQQREKQQQQRENQQQCQQQQQEEEEVAVALTGEEEGVAQALPFGRLVELPGGCLCCSLRGELLQALDSLLSLVESRIDAILIETNGAADPQPIIEALWTDTPMLAKTTLDGVVCLVDASHPHRALADAENFTPAPAAAAAADAAEEAAEGGLKNSTTFESHGGLGVVAVKQLALADSILLTKEDAAGEEQLLLLQQQLQKLNPGAPIYRCCKGRAPLHAILGLGAYSGDRCSSSLIGRGPLPMTPEAAAAAAAAQALWEQQRQQQHQHECAHGGGGCHHDVGGLTSVLLSFSLGRQAALAGGPSRQRMGGPLRLFSLQRLQQAVGDLLWPEEAADAADTAPAAAAATAAARHSAAAAAAEAKGEACESAIFRCKGVFTAWKDDFSEDEQDAGSWGVYELQGVGRSFEVRPVDPLSAAAAAAAAAFAADASGESEARFLFVGSSLSKQQLHEKLEACLVIADV
ncbi:hypothetical protein ACSSS7_000490 [Eimeria intestinalis]